MLKETLKDIRTHILQHNAYFSNGYSNVYMSEHGVSEGETVVFPNDTLGDYFYMRIPNGANITNSRQASVSACVAGLDVKMSVILIAVVKAADADILSTNIASTLATFTGVSVTNIMWQQEEIILQELSKIGEGNVNAALARLTPGVTIVCVKFDYNTVVNPNGLNCLPNPCACS